MLTIMKNIVFIITPKKICLRKYIHPIPRVFFFFFFHLTRLTILLVGGFLISKTPGFNKISRACDLWWKA